MPLFLAAPSTPRKLKMARTKSTIPAISKHFMLPLPIVTRMETELYSEVEQRIPLGAQAALLTSLLEKHFAEVDKLRAEADIMSNINQFNSKGLK